VFQTPVYRFSCLKSYVSSLISIEKKKKSFAVQLDAMQLNFNMILQTKYMHQCWQ